jgi:MSHA biogenesis protein MshI
VLALFGRKKRVEGLVGLSVNDSRIALAHVTRRRDDLMLERCLRQPVGKPGAARELLARLVDEQGLLGAACSCVLSPSDYNIYLVEAPQVEADEISAAVRWKIKDLLDMPVEDALIDVFPVPEDAFQGRNKMLYAVAASRPRIEQLIATVNRAGLELVAIDIPEMAMRNISNQFLDDSNGLAFISLKQSGSTLNISRNGQLYLTRRINTPVGPDALMQNDWDMLRDRLVLEIQRSLDYAESQMGLAPVRQIMIAPRERDTESMMNALADGLANPVGMADFIHELPAHDDISPEVKGASMLTIGAALRNDDERVSS